MRHNRPRNVLVACVATAALLAAVTAARLSAPALAQVPAPPPTAAVVQVHAGAVQLPAGGAGKTTLVLTIAPGWHINSNPPSPDMIPTAVMLEPADGIAAGEPAYPPARVLKLAFDPDPLRVWSGTAEIVLPVTATTTTTGGTHTVTGTVRYQACNDQLCAPPKSVPFELQVMVTGAPSTAPAGSEPPGASSPGGVSSSAGALPATGAAPTRGGFTTGPPAGGAAADNPITRALAQGGLTAFLALVAAGLLLNLTPCVYPMIGVTVSLFGGRRAAPPLQVFGMAVVYVLGMATMYTALGVVAALTGGLFGGWLQSPAVGVGIGLLLVVMSLSLFGLYELQIPPALLTRLGGNTATNVAGIFLAGLVVGVFAAPCTGPVIVALLAVVGQKADPWFGFKSFFSLALGLGLPYLVLGTFSNLLQRLPRSGEWMMWVKKVFGVVLFAIGLFYALIAVAPRFSAWVAPAALIVGGLAFGVFDRGATRGPAFRWLKRLGGVAAVAGGIALVLPLLPRPGVAFEPFTPAAAEGLARPGKPVLLDFSADWCLPCRELEQKTFHDGRVIAAAREFRTYRVDLTHFDSPDVQALRERWKIAGVPTIVFLKADGSEVADARVEGFLAPEDFLDRMKQAR